MRKIDVNARPTAGVKKPSATRLILDVKGGSAEIRVDWPKGQDTKLLGMAIGALTTGGLEEQVYAAVADAVGRNGDGPGGEELIGALEDVGPMVLPIHAVALNQGALE